MDENKLYENVGYIRGTVDAIQKDVKEQNTKIASLTKKVNKHEVIFGKIGLAFTVIVFGLTTIFNVGIDWVKGKLNM